MTNRLSPLSHPLRCVAVVAAALSLPALCMAQKKVTPVDNDPARPDQPVLHYYDKHGNQLAEPVLFLSQLDTVRNVRSGPVYPLLESVSVGFDFFDAVMLLAGQSYSSFSASASLSLHNWIIPTVEVGMGRADNTPELNNYHYRCKPSPFFKLGCDYNFLYKSNPAYRLTLGVRLGWSAFKYDIDDITISSDYWDQTERFALPTQSANVLWGEALLGLRVKIAGPVSLGWNVRLHKRLHTKPGTHSTPWFVPGCGANSSVGGSFSLFYTLPLARREAPSVHGDEGL